MTLAKNLEKRTLLDGKNEYELGKSVSELRQNDWQLGKNVLELKQNESSYSLHPIDSGNRLPGNQSIQRVLSKKSHKIRKGLEIQMKKSRIHIFTKPFKQRHHEGRISSSLGRMFVHMGRINHIMGRMSRHISSIQ